MFFPRHLTMEILVIITLHLMLEWALASPVDSQSRIGFPDNLTTSDFCALDVQDRGEYRLIVFGRSKEMGGWIHLGPGMEMSIDHFRPTNPIPHNPPPEVFDYLWGKFPRVGLVCGSGTLCRLSESKTEFMFTPNSHHRVEEFDMYPSHPLILPKASRFAGDIWSDGMAHYAFCRGNQTGLQAMTTVIPLS